MSKVKILSSKSKHGGWGDKDNTQNPDGSNEEINERKKDAESEEEATNIKFYESTVGGDEDEERSGFTLLQETSEFDSEEDEGTSTKHEYIEDLPVVDNVTILDEVSLNQEKEPDTTEVRRYISIQETVIDDLGVEVLTEQMVPVVKEIIEYEQIPRDSVEIEEYDVPTIKSSDSRQHIYIEKINTTVLKTLTTESGEDFVTQINVHKEVVHGERPPLDAVVYYKTYDEDGNEIRNMLSSSEIYRVTNKKVENIRIESEDYSFEGVRANTREIAPDEKRLNQRLKNILIKIALEKKRQSKLIKLISLSVELAENFLNKNDKQEQADNVNRNKGQDQWKPLYLKQLMEHRKLRDAFIRKLTTEKDDMIKVQSEADRLETELEETRKIFLDLLNTTVAKLKPKHLDIFNVQSPEKLIEHIKELELKIMEERKMIIEKENRLKQLKEVITTQKMQEDSLCYRYDLYSKELDIINGKNDRRYAKLELLKKTIRENCLSLAHTDQKLVSARKIIASQNEKLSIVQQYLLENRIKRQEVHKKRMEVEDLLKTTLNNYEITEYPLLLKEYENLQKRMTEKKALLLKLKQEYRDKDSINQQIQKNRS